MDGEFRTPGATSSGCLGSTGTGQGDLLVHDTEEKRSQSEEAALPGRLPGTLSRDHILVHVHLLEGTNQQEEPRGSSRGTARKRGRRRRQKEEERIPEEGRLESNQAHVDDFFVLPALLPASHAL